MIDTWPVAIVAAVAIVGLRIAAERSLPENDAETVACEDEHARRWVVRLFAALVLLTVALILESSDVPGAGPLAVVAFAGVLFLVFVAPWLPRQRRRTDEPPSTAAGGSRDP